MWTALVIAAALGQAPAAGGPPKPKEIPAGSPSIVMPSPEFQAELRAVAARRRMRHRRGQMRYHLAAARAPLAMGQFQATIASIQAAQSRSVRLPLAYDVPVCYRETHDHCEPGRLHLKPSGESFWW